MNNWEERFEEKWMNEEVSDVQGLNGTNKWIVDFIRQVEQEAYERGRRELIQNIRMVWVNNSEWDDKDKFDIGFIDGYEQAVLDIFGVDDGAEALHKQEQSLEQELSLPNQKNRSNV